MQVGGGPAGSVAEEDCSADSVQRVVARSGALALPCLHDGTRCGVARRLCVPARGAPEAAVARHEHGGAGPAADRGKVGATGLSVDALVLKLSNIAIPVDAADESLPAGEFVGLTLLGPGAWGQDERWAPGASVEGLLANLGGVAQAAGSPAAYSRLIGGVSSLTVLLPRSKEA